MEADGIRLRRRQKNRAAEKRQPLILQVFIERLTRRTINDRAVVIADLLASLLELLKLPAGINMLILELPGDDLILIDDTLLHNSDIPLHELYLLMLIVQRSVHVASVNQRLQKHPFLRLLYLYDAFKLLLEFFQQPMQEVLHAFTATAPLSLLLHATTVFASAGTSLITKFGHAFVHIPQPVHFAGSTQATPLLL